MSDREIKFKLWDMDNEVMIYPPNPYDSMHGNKFFTLDGHCYVNGVHQNFILLQYTEVNAGDQAVEWWPSDNAQEIYHCDIVEVHREDSFKDYIAVVEYGKGCFGTIDQLGQFIPLYGWGGENYKVIGNIYENPELAPDEHG
jgi:hypothetical protein